MEDMHLHSFFSRKMLVLCCDNNGLNHCIILHSNCVNTSAWLSHSAFITDEWNWPFSSTPETPAGAGLEIMTLLAVLTMFLLLLTEKL